MSRSKHLPEEWTDLQRSEYLTVHEFERHGRRGAQAVAPIVGKSPATLSNEVNPNMETHKLGLENSVVLQTATDDYRILEAYARDLGHIVIPMPDFPPVSDMELLNQYAEWQAALGRTNQEIRDCLEDGAVEAFELAAIQRRAHEHMAAFQMFLQRLESLVEEK